MNIFKKIGFGLIGLFIFLFIVSNSITATTLQKGMIEQNILNPLGLVVASSQSPLKSSSVSDYSTFLTNKYNNFDDYGGNWNPTNSYTCIVGGIYKINILSNPVHAGLFNASAPLFYCRTTNDLIKSAKIPASWTQDNLILYCNDGGAINSPTHNFDFITSKLNTYKACILKNLDTQKTILFGFDVGNKTIDSNKDFFFNSSSDQGGIINSNLNFIKKDSNGYVFNDSSNGMKYYFSYDSADAYYSLTNSNQQLNTGLNTVFNKNIGISRVALFRHYSNQENIYGYEKSINMFSSTNTNKVLPVYDIVYGNALPMSSSECAQYLQKYGAKDYGNPSISDKVICRGVGNNKEILINSYAIDGSGYGKTSAKSFNLFKNIILSLNN